MRVLCAAALALALVALVSQLHGARATPVTQVAPRSASRSTAEYYQTLQARLRQLTLSQRDEDDDLDDDDDDEEETPSPEAPGGSPGQDRPPNPNGAPSPSATPGDGASQNARGDESDDDDDGNGSAGGLSAGAIAGIAIVACVAVIALVGAAVLLTRKRAGHSRASSDTRGSAGSNGGGGPPPPGASGGDNLERGADAAVGTAAISGAAVGAAGAAGAAVSSGSDHGHGGGGAGGGGSASGGGGGYSHGDVPGQQLPPGGDRDGPGLGHVPPSPHMSNMTQSASGSHMPLTMSYATDSMSGSNDGRGPVVGAMLAPRPPAIKDEGYGAYEADRHGKPLAPGMAESVITPTAPSVSLFSRRDSESSSASSETIVAPEYGAVPSTNNLHQNWFDSVSRNE